MEGNLNLNKQKSSEQEPADYVNLDIEEPFAELPTEEQPNPEAAKENGENAGALIANKDSEEDRDAKSVFVKNVNYNAEKKEIEEHFADCGEIKLITIL